MKIKNLTLIALSCLIFISISTNITKAADFTQKYQSFLQQVGITGTYDVTTQGNSDFVNSFLGRMILLVIGFTGIFFLGLTLYSGFQWMTAGGNEDKVAEAKKRVLNGTIGIAIALSAFILTNLLFSYFNEHFINNNPNPGIENAPQQQWK